MLLLWIVCLTLCIECFCVTSVADYNALESFYYATNGTYWVYPEFSRSVRWNFTGGYEQQNPCADRWQGVTCDYQDTDACASSTVVCNVRKLNLSNYELSGPVPLALANFTDIHDIFLSENFLTGWLPPAVTVLPSLRFLDISDNNLYGKLPMVYNAGLEGLLLKRNWISGSIPPALYQLQNLTDLSLRENSLTDMSMDSMQPNWQSIQRFDVAYNKMPGELPQSVLCSWTTIEELDLAQNFLYTDQLSDCFCDLPILSQLIFFLNDLRGTLPACLTNTPNIHLLDVGLNKLSGKLPPQYSPALRSLILSVNSFTGTIPTAVGAATDLRTLVLQHNQLTSTIPSEIGGISTLSALILDTNFLVGTLPTSLGQLTGLGLLLLSDNCLSGTIPLALYTNLHEMADFRASTNQFSGSIPSAVTSNWPLCRVFDVTDNLITGSLPTNMGNMGLLRYLLLYMNQITGPIPTTIGALSAAAYLKFDTNLMTGTIPTQLSQLRSAVEITFYSNSFTSTIPEIFDQMPALVTLQLQLNQFTGQPGGVFANSSAFPKLEMIDLSNNEFTGTIPYELFSLPAVNNIGAASNCFHGDLTTAICNAVNIQVLNLNGLDSSANCRVSIISKSILPSAYVGKHYIHGSIPSCIWALEKMNTLGLSGNSLKGQLSGTEVITPTTSSLTNLTLSYNRLSGVIPPALQLWRGWRDLNLENNRFRGNIEQMEGIFRTQWCDKMGTQCNVTLNLVSNRLSGDIPPSFTKAHGLQILAGNLFQCRQDNIPVNDPKTSGYICGSLSLDASLVAWGALAGLVVVLVASHWAWEWYIAYMESPVATETTDGHHQSGSGSGSAGGTGNVNVAAGDDNAAAAVVVSPMVDVLTKEGVVHIGATSSSGGNTANAPVVLGRGTLSPYRSTIMAKASHLRSSISAWLDVTEPLSRQTAFASPTSTSTITTGASASASASAGASAGTGVGAGGGANNNSSTSPGTLTDYFVGSSSLLSAESEKSSLSSQYSSDVTAGGHHRFNSSNHSNSSDENSSGPTSMSGTTATVSAQQFLINHEEYLPELNRYISLLKHIRLTVCILLGILLLFNTPLYAAVKTNDNWSTHQYQYQWYVSAALMQGAVPAALTCVSWFVVCFTLLYMMLLLKGSKKPTLPEKDKEKKENTDSSNRGSGCTEDNKEHEMLSTSWRSSSYNRGSMSSFRSLRGGGKAVVAVPLGVTALNSGENADSDRGSETESEKSSNSSRNSKASSSVSIALSAAAAGGGAGSMSELRSSGGGSLSGSMAGSEQFMLSRKYASEPELAAHVVAPPSRSVLKKYTYLVLAGLLNAAIVLSAKGVYLYVVLTGSESYVLTIMAEILLAAFDLVWNWTVVTSYLNYLATIVEFTPNALILVKVFAFMFNSVAAPCVVAALSDPDCIREVFVPPESISTSYTYPYCYTLDVSYTDSCPLTKDAVVYTTYIPPFVYNFQCGSAMLTDYIPVFMFVYIFITFIMPTVYIIVLYLGPQRLYPWIVRVMPGLFWPGVADKVRILYKRSNGECVYDLSPRLCNSISKPDTVVSSLMHHFVVLTTFGVASPPLAFCIALSMITIVFFWQTLLGRYIQVCIELNHLDELAILEQEVAGAWKGSRSSARMLIIGASLFYGFFFYDITCAELGWMLSSIFPLVVIGVPICVFSIMGSKRLRGKYVGTYHLPIIGEVVIAQVPAGQDGFGSDDDNNDDDDEHENEHGNEGVEGKGENKKRKRKSKKVEAVATDGGDNGLGLQRTNTVTVDNPFVRTSTWNPYRQDSNAAGGEAQSFVNLFTRTNTTHTATAAAAVKPTAVFGAGARDGAVSATPMIHMPRDSSIEKEREQML